MITITFYGHHDYNKTICVQNNVLFLPFFIYYKLELDSILFKQTSWHRRVIPAGGARSHTHTHTYYTLLPVTHSTSVNSSWSISGKKTSQGNSCSTSVMYNLPHHCDSIPACHGVDTHSGH